MPIKDLIAQLQLILDSDGNLPVFILKKDSLGELLVDPMPMILDVTKEWKSHEGEDLNYFTVGDLLVLL